MVGSMQGKGIFNIADYSGKRLNNEQGSTLIIAILVLFILTALGIVALNSTHWEIGFSRTDKFAKMSLSQADAGAEVSKELIEQAIEDRGFPDVPGAGAPPFKILQVTVVNPDLYFKPDLGSQVPADNDANRDIYLEVDSGRTNVLIGANQRLSTGGAIHMGAGYEGLGKGASGGGAWILYDIRSQHEGPGDTWRRIKSQWLHVM